MRNGTEAPSPAPDEVKLVTVRQRGDCATDSSTVAPGCAIPEADGDWCVTVPAGCPAAGTAVTCERSPAAARTRSASEASCPTTAGTGTSRGPSLRTTFTLEFRLARLPAPGCCSIA